MLISDRSMTRYLPDFGCSSRPGGKRSGQEPRYLYRFGAAVPWSRLGELYLSSFISQQAGAPPPSFLPSYCQRGQNILSCRTLAHPIRGRAPPFLTGPNYAYLSQRDLGSSLVGTQCSRRDASAECRHEAEAPTAFPRCRSCGRTDRGIRLWCHYLGDGGRTGIELAFCFV